MSNNINTNSKNNKFNRGLKLLSAHYRAPVRKLVLHLKEINPYKYTDVEIERISGIRAQELRDWIREVEEDNG